MGDTRPPGHSSEVEGENDEEDTNELIRYETVTSPGLRTYSEIHFAQGSDAGQTELREVMKIPLGRVGRAALALIGKFPSEEVSAKCTGSRKSWKWEEWG
jgi:hypothetical protein